MLFKWLFGESSDRAPTASDELRALCAQAMPGADEQSVAIVGALSGLLATVAHADRNYSEAEQAAVREALTKVHGISASSLTAIESLLAEHIAELSHEPLQTYTRVLYEGLERTARLEVLEVLMDLAAADDVLDMQETNLLRRIARGLGLSDDEYVASQERHRPRLSVLRSS